MEKVVERSKNIARWMKDERVWSTWSQNSGHNRCVFLQVNDFAILQISMWQHYCIDGLSAAHYVAPASNCCDRPKVCASSGWDEMC